MTEVVLMLAGLAVTAFAVAWVIERKFRDKDDDQDT